MRLMPVAVARRVAVCEGGRRVDWWVCAMDARCLGEEGGGAGMSRVWRPLRLSRARHCKDIGGGGGGDWVEGEGEGEGGTEVEGGGEGGLGM